MDGPPHEAIHINSNATIFALNCHLDVIVRDHSRRRLTKFPILLYPHGMVDCNPSPQIGGIPPHDRARALELVFGYLPLSDRLRQIREASAHISPPGCGPFEGLLGAYRSGQQVGAVFSQLQPGKTAIVWLPRLTAEAPPSTAAALLAATWNLLARHRVVLTQVLLPAADKAQSAMLRLGGISHLADLLYLISPEGEISNEPSATRLEFEPYDTTNHDRLSRVLEATYEDTLDCPGLQGVRNTEDILAGYRSAGAFDPQRWLIVRNNRRDVGCVLLADHPRHNNMELLYLGLIPAARGRGLGKQLVRHAQRIAQLDGRRRLVLAVDLANAPAVQTYTAVGFQEWQRRRLYVKQLPSTDNWHASFQQVIHAGGPTHTGIFAASRLPS